MLPPVRQEVCDPPGTRLAQSVEHETLNLRVVGSTLSGFVSRFG